MEPTGPPEKHAEYVFSVDELKRLIEMARGAESIAIKVMIQPLGQKTFVLEVFAVAEDKYGKEIEIESSYQTEGKRTRIPKKAASATTVMATTMMATASTTRAAVKGCPRPPSC